MAGLWQRFALIFKSKASRALDRAENPTETLDYSYEQMLQQLQNVKRGVADVVTAKKRLELQTQTIEQNVVKLETQARQAVAANRDDLAKEALQRKATAQQQLQGLDAQVQQLQTQQDQLVASQQQLEARQKVLHEFPRIRNREVAAHGIGHCGGLTLIRQLGDELVTCEHADEVT